MASHRPRVPVWAHCPALPTRSQAVQLCFFEAWPLQAGLGRPGRLGSTGAVIEGLQDSAALCVSRRTKLLPTWGTGFTVTADQFLLAVSVPLSCSCH